MLCRRGSLWTKIPIPSHQSSIDRTFRITKRKLYDDKRICTDQINLFLAAENGPQGVVWVVISEAIANPSCSVSYLPRQYSNDFYLQVPTRDYINVDPTCLQIKSSNQTACCQGLSGRNEWPFNDALDGFYHLLCRIPGILHGNTDLKISMAFQSYFVIALISRRAPLPQHDLLLQTLPYEMPPS